MLNTAAADTVAHLQCDSRHSSQASTGAVRTSDAKEYARQDTEDRDGESVSHGHSHATEGVQRSAKMPISAAHALILHASTSMPHPISIDVPAKAKRNIGLRPEVAKGDERP